jgi:hypothetical protein
VQSNERVSRELASLRAWPNDPSLVVGAARLRSSNWAPSGRDHDLVSATGILAGMVQSADEIGCGLESQLEAWFRFLIDPVPPIYPIQKGANRQSYRSGSDDALLAQRAAFLRPDSLMVIIMLTDENDCSLRDTDVGWVATDTYDSLKTGSAVCLTNPNDPCCYSCTSGGPPSGCADGCGSNPGQAQDDSGRQANLRCFHQKRRFGYEFMYPTARYVVGLTKHQLIQSPAAATEGQAVILAASTYIPMIVAT